MNLLQLLLRLGIVPAWLREDSEMPGLFFERNTQQWTAEELDKLCAAFSMGRPVPDIARDLGRSQEAVRGKAQRLGLTQRRTRRARPLMTVGVVDRSQG